MCGRYAFYPDERIYKRFDIENMIEELLKSYNVAPGQSMPVVTHHSPNTLEIMKWGLIPFWAKDPKIGYKMINARAETIKDKASFRNSLKSKRCLVPANGFFEWQVTEDKIKVPYYIHLKREDYFAFAGLYDVWKDAEGKEVRTYTIITTEPNSLMAPIHNRMPVILKKEDEALWINPEEQDIDKLLSFLKPYPAEAMEAYSISQDVNSPRNNNKEIITPQNNKFDGK